MMVTMVMMVMIVMMMIDDDDEDEDDDWASGGQQFISTVVFESIARKTKSQVGCLQASHHTERCMYLALWSPACTY